MTITTWIRAGAPTLALAVALAMPGVSSAADGSRSGRDIYESFRAGLAEPNCPTQADRWARQYADAPQRLASGGDNTLMLFGHVVDSLRAAHLPTEYALIPFVESGYRANARSAAGPAGLWQMIASTARNHNVPMRPGYDGRLSPVDSTRAAVRYLKTLHGMFAGNWRLAVMAYNVGEYRVFGALRRSGQSPASGRADSLAGLPDITRVYDDKLHAISCVIAQADKQPRWLAALNRPVPRLGSVASSDSMVAMRDDRSQTRSSAIAITDASAQGTRSIGASIVAGGSAASMLGSAPTSPTPSTDTGSIAAIASADVAAANAPRRHTVAAGESLSRIARQYRVSVSDLLNLNRLQAGKLLAPGMVLAVDTLVASPK